MAQKPPTCEHLGRMNLDFGLEDWNVCQKMKNRWLFKIDGVSATVSGSISALPPLKGGRPKLDLVEQEVQHLVQKVYYPVKAEWKPIQLTLYDITRHNPVFLWLEMVYSPQPSGGFYEWNLLSPEFCQATSTQVPFDDQQSCFKRTGAICIYGGCGELLEAWKLDNCWPQSIDWGDLDMADSNVITVDVTLRYDRAYLVFPERPSTASPNTYTGGTNLGGVPSPNN